MYSSSAQYHVSGARQLLREVIQKHVMIYDGNWMENIWKRMDISATQATSQCLEDACESLVSWLNCVSEDHAKDLYQRHIDIIMNILSMLPSSKAVSVEPSSDIVSAQEDQVHCAMTIAALSMGKMSGESQSRKKLVDGLVGLCACHLDRLKWFENVRNWQLAEAQKADDSLTAMKQLLCLRVAAYNEKIERTSSVLQQLKQDTDDRYADLCAVAVKSRAQLLKSGESKHASAYLAFEKVISSRDPHVVQLIKARDAATASIAQQTAVLTRLKYALAAYRSLRALCECVTQEREQVLTTVRDQLVIFQLEAVHLAETELLRCVPVLTNASLEYCQLKLHHRAKAQETLHEQRMELEELETWFCGWGQSQYQPERRRMENRIRTLRAASDASKLMVMQVVESQRKMWTTRRDLLPISVLELVDEGIAKMQNLRTAAETPPESSEFTLSQEVRSYVNRNGKRPSYMKPEKQWKVKVSGNKRWDSEYFARTGPFFMESDSKLPSFGYQYFNLPPLLRS